MERFHNKNQFYSNSKQIWVVKNYFPKILTVVNYKKNAKVVSTFSLRTLYTTIPHIVLIKVLNEIIYFS